MESPLDRESSVDREYHSAMECHHVLGDDAFQNETSRDLFNAIDELKSCGASRDIHNLPEIVIVGDQSVGKSSLLQSLTEIPFPVAGKLCTRFPTRIVSRRDAKERTKVSIEPRLFSALDALESNAQRDARQARQSRYKEFEKSYTLFQAEDFLSVVESASQFMQIGNTPSSQQNTESKSAPLFNFSEDTLKIEIQGPKRSHFAILDLPGNFQSLTGSLVDRDMKLVRNMALQYMGQDQSIIVCVASGPTDLANQGVFDMASEKDRKGDRTIGVITKCDVTQEPSEVVEIVKNETKPLRHGWFVVRNRTPSEVKDQVSSQEHHRMEHEFFCEKPWTTIPEHRRGTQALKKTLANLLCTRFRTVFPSILKDIQNQQKQNQQALEDLGTPRGTLGQKRAYLSDIALDFHTQISQAFQGQYASISQGVAKLRMKVREANDEFAIAMKTKGHAIAFVERPHIVNNHKRRSNKSHRFPPVNGDEPASSGTEDESSSGTTGLTPQLTSAFSFGSSIKPGFKDHGKPSGVTSNPKAATKSMFGDFSSQGAFSAKPTSSPFSFGLPPQDDDSETIYKWIRAEIKASRGTELQGTLNPSILPILFHRQIRNWKTLAQEHFTKIKLSAEQAYGIVLRSACKDETTRRKIETFIDSSSERQEKLYSRQLSQHIDSLQKKHLQTNNEAFEQKIKSARLMRFHAALERFRQARPYRSVENGNGRAHPEANDDKLVVDMRDTAALFAELHMSNSQNLEDEIHDTLKAYYEIARENFIHFVNDQVVEHYLDDEKGPVYAFSPAYVGGLTDAQVEEMAAEDDSLVRDRAEREATLRRLSKAEKIAEKCMRPK